MQRDDFMIIQKRDILPEKNIPLVSIPDISQADFNEAFKVLEECLVVKLPVNGFTYPFMGPGGAYGDNWWLRDTTLTLTGSKWINQKYAEDVLYNFINVQKEDGRIPLWGYDTVPFIEGEISAIPRIFEVAYDILKRSDNEKLITDVYQCLKRYLNWWFAKRLDNESGLITGVFEEADPSDCLEYNTKAHVDLNIQVLIGCHVLEDLALRLKHNDDYIYFTTKEKELRDAINSKMYNRETKAYHAYYVQKKALCSRLYSSTFDALRLNTAYPERIDKILDLLTDHNYFNWDTYAITSLSKTDPEYVETKGDYQGYTSWMGNVWTFRNEIVIAALNDIGAFDLSAYLTFSTIRSFNNNYAEFISPTDGSPHGVKRYGWTASSYIQLIIEQLFGIEYSNFDKCIYITPHIPKVLYGATLSISNLHLPNGGVINVEMIKTDEELKISFEVSDSEKDFSVVVSDLINNPDLLSKSYSYNLSTEASSKCAVQKYYKGQKFSVNLGCNYKNTVIFYGNK